MLTTNVLCMKKRKKRRYSVSNVSDYKSKPTTDKRSSSAVTMMHITEDTPPDMLAGAMDLTVHLPNGRAVKMSVERSTPMMDLLVQIVTVHHLQLSGHIIQALEMAPSAGISDKILPYKPNTPIGALDTQHIKVVPKNRNMPVSRSAALPGHQPFESTFRLKVHLPRNQLYVTRVSQNVYLEDIMSKVCKEKDLDALKYEFRHPGNLDEVLDPKLTLSDYQITEIYVVSRGSGRLTQAFSTSDIMALRKEEERKQFQAKTGGGVFNLIFKRGKPNPAMTTTGSVSSDTRSISPTHSDDSRSVTPPAFQPPIIKEPPPPEKPKPPQRKRRPAPKPPQMVEERRSSDEKPTSQISERSQNSDSKKVENGLTICHSRNSSDSSGYHEASVLSENCNNTSLPRRPKTITTTEDVTDSANLSGEHSKSTGNLIKMTSESKSTSSLAFTSRKKKAAPPPPQPVLKTEISKAENASPTVVASQNVEMRKESTSTFPTNQTPPESLPSTQSQSSSSSVRTSVSLQQTPKPVNTPDISNETQSVELKIESTHSIEETHTDKVSLSTCDNKNEVDSGICENISTENLEKNDLDLESDWQYQLPSPPRGFRDASPVATAIPSNFDTETVPDSVVTSPELFEKLKQVKNTQEIDNDSVLSEEDKEICNKLTLEHLEKRKSLVYNRELATSLKCVPQTYNLMASRKSTVLNELENVISNQQTTTLLKNPIKTNTHKSTTYDKNLPNFKITTYDVKKDKINIFEDDTVRSNADFRRSSLNIENNVSDKSDAENVSLLTNGNHKQEKDTLTTHAISNESIFCPKRDLNENGKEDKVAVQKTTSEVTYAKKSEDNFTMGKEGYSESFSIRKNSADDIFKKPHELSKYRLKNSFFEKNKNVNTFNTNYGIGRSESFSNNEAWTPSNPVKRSKSQVALNKYKDENLVKSIGGSTENLSKSGVLFDVSGLQSLEVIRLIQTKLSNSSEQLDSLAHAENPKKEETKSPIVNSTPVTKIYQNRGPPSINVSSWSQRPKTQVTLKEDTDYKHNSINTRNGFVNDLSGNTAARTQSHSRVKINGVDCETKNENVSIKVNGSETISQQKSGNVVIKIGSMDDKIKNDRFINHITPDGYRKPLGNINKIERSSRPHSIAFDSQFDISRVPIVRSVELKKPFKDLHTNKSVTQIYSESNDLKRQDDAPKSLNYDTNLKNSHVYLSNESINKSVFRNGSITPVVKGFRTENGNITNANRKTWNLYGTLPAKTNNQTDLTTNKNVPFSQSNLRRTESNKTIPNVVDKGSIFGNVVLRNNSNSFKNTESILPSPPPPVNLDLLHHDNVIFPKKSKMSECNGEPREELLSAIRNFGGKNGLRTAKR